MFSQSPVSTVGYQSYCDFFCDVYFFQLNGDISISYDVVSHLPFL